MKIRRIPDEVPGRVVRLVAAQVAVLGGLAVATGLAWPVVLLAADFGLRAFASPRFSPLAFAARAVAHRLPGGAGAPVLYAPKRFAATLGAAFMTASAFLFALPGTGVAGRVVAGMVVSLALLEAGLGVCVGCALHGLLVRWGVLRAPVCVDCVPRR